MNNAPWVPPLILPTNNSQPDFIVYYIIVGCITFTVHSTISYWPEKLCCHGNLMLDRVPLFESNLIYTSCITNEYCTMFHPSSAQVWCHLHKLQNIVLCSTPRAHLYMLHNYCITEFHHSSAQYCTLNLWTRKLSRVSDFYTIIVGYCCNWILPVLWMVSWLVRCTWS